MAAVVHLRTAAQHDLLQYLDIAAILDSNIVAGNLCQTDVASIDKQVGLGAVCDTVDGAAFIDGAFVIERTAIELYILCNDITCIVAIGAIGSCDGDVAFATDLSTFKHND